MDPRRLGKTASSTGISLSQERLRMNHLRQRQITPGNTTEHNKRNPAPPQHSMLGKRSRHDSRETSRDRSNVTNKRPRHTYPSSTNELCDQCDRIPWDKIDQWIGHEGRIDWRGKLIVKVGKRYRNVPRSTTCQLCRQLHAPWIQPFLKTLDPSQWKGNYFGDQIHIFRHLRHLTHVNDFPTSMKVLRENNAPYHIAVVPFGRGWRRNLQAHIASHGMVVVVPKGRPQSEIFIPQQVSEKFDPRAALQWLEFCKHHKTLCNPKSTNVSGMKVIDCDSEDRIIQGHRLGDKYVALSYVWGNPAPSKTPTLAPTGNKTPQREVCIKTKVKGPQMIARTSQEIPNSKPNLILKKSLSNQTSATVIKTAHCVAAAPQNISVSRLPDTVPLTIRDAIQVTKALGYRFLWVDKYCIDQKSEPEKQQQCSRMGDIYAGAQVTIFALGSHSNYGLPGVSSKRRGWQEQCTTKGKYKFIFTMPDPHISINQSKWSTRGWTYQEGLFSTRCLFFTDYQAYFECNAMNCVETFKSNLNILHTQSVQRLRSYHRAGKFVCGNSNKFSHLNVKQNKANHRKIDTIRRCQHYIREYTRTELTHKGDILDAFAGIARFYAQTTAKIVSLAGIPIPFPIATSGDVGRTHLDHLSYALAWTHQVHKFTEPRRENAPNQPEPAGARSPWTPHDNPKPQRRKGFPSWSWAGWFGEIGLRWDLPYCWTSYLSGVRIGFRAHGLRDFAWLAGLARYRQLIIQRLLTADELRFDAYVLKPEKLRFWDKDAHMPSRQIPSKALHVNLSVGPCSLRMFHQRLMERELECLVIGTYGEPREDVFKAIQAADKKAPKARVGRIGLFERREPDTIVCLVVRTVDGTSYRCGLLRIEFEGSGGECALQALDLGPKRSFILR